MKLTLYVFLLSGAIFLCNSCASIVSRKPPVSIVTRPAGANISIINKKGKEVFSGTSPVEVQLKPGAGYFSKASYTVKLNLPGYEEKTVQLAYGINGWYFGNLLLGGVIGMLIVDPISGHMWTIKNPIVNETLVKAATTVSNERRLKIVDINEISPEMRSQLVKLN